MAAATKKYAEKQAGGNFSGNNKNPKKSGNSKGSKAKMRIRKAGAGIKNFLIAIVILAAATVIFLFFTNKYFFKIKHINITENDKYSYDEISGILEASGIFPGGELYGADVKKAKSDIKEKLTYTESVSITRIPPSTINIDIKTEKGFLGIMLGGDYYVVSKNFRVIDKISVVGKGMDESDFEPPEGVITFETDAIKKCYIGEKMEFSDGDISDFFKDIAALFDDDENGDNGENKDNHAGMVSAINGIDVTNKFKVVMNYGDRFLVRFGIFENISSKILNSFEIIKQLPDYAEGIIDMTDGKTASFRYDENVSKLYKSNKSRRG